MDSEVVIGALAVLLAATALGLAAWWYIRRRQRRRLKERFGPEYERAVGEVGDRRQAEAVLEERQRRVRQFRIRPLLPAQMEFFTQQWRRIQGRFVDDPDATVGAADRLIAEVMAARGYPIEDFEQRATDLSVEHPRVVDNYRAAHAVAVRHEHAEATTEELRRALVHYRALFDDLVEATPRQVRRRVS